MDGYTRRRSQPIKFSLEDSRELSEQPFNLFDSTYSSRFKSTLSRGHSLKTIAMHAYSIQVWSWVIAPSGEHFSQRPRAGTSEHNRASSCSSLRLKHSTEGSHFEIAATDIARFNGIACDTTQTMLTDVSINYSWSWCDRNTDFDRECSSVIWTACTILLWSDWFGGETFFPMLCLASWTCFCLSHY